MKKNKENTFIQIKSLLVEYLELCDKKKTPYLCKQKETAEGRKEIEDYVLQSVYYGGNTIGEALRQKERALNPNIIND